MRVGCKKGRHSLLTWSDLQMSIRLVPGRLTRELRNWRTDLFAGLVPVWNCCVIRCLFSAPFAHPPPSSALSCQTAALHVKASARLFLPSLSQRPVTVFLFIRVDLIHFHKLHRRGPIKSLENKLIVSKGICLQRRFLDQLGDELVSYGNHKLSAHSHRDLKGGFFGQRNSEDKGATVDFWLVFLSRIYKSVSIQFDCSARAMVVVTQTTLLW